MKFSSVFALLNGLIVSAKVPIFMYVDQWDKSPSDLLPEFVRMAESGVSTIILGFYVEGNPTYPNTTADTVSLWAQLPQPQRASIRQKLHQLGTKLIISAGGEMEGDHWLKQQPKAYAQRACTTVKGFDVDGICFDKVGMDDKHASAADWNIAATRQCREVWPDGLITSAPLSRHVVGYGGSSWADGLLAESANDYYFIKYYDQGTWTEDTTYEGLMFKPGAGSLKELWKDYRGLYRPDQFVIGKPYLSSHASSGFVDHATLRTYICKAWIEEGYRGGIMFWKAPFGEDLSDVKMLSQPCETA